MRGYDEDLNELIKLCCQMRFTHELTTLHCIFKVLTSEPWII